VIEKRVSPSSYSCAVTGKIWALGRACAGVWRPPPTSWGPNKKKPRKCWSHRPRCVPLRGEETCPRPQPWYRVPAAGPAGNRKSLMIRAGLAPPRITCWKGRVPPGQEQQPQSYKKEDVRKRPNLVRIVASLGVADRCPRPRRLRDELTHSSETGSPQL